MSVPVDREALIAERRFTLCGSRAVVTGRLLDYPMVTMLDPPQFSVECTWGQLARAQAEERFAVYPEYKIVKV